VLWNLPADPDMRTFHTGQITPNDLKEGSFMNRKKSFMLGLPTVVEMSFERKNCKLLNEKVVGCYNGLLKGTKTTAHFSLDLQLAFFKELNMSFESVEQLTTFIVGGYGLSYKTTYYTGYSDQCFSTNAVRTQR
jgi:hypothetical protein